eukprot:gene15004-biopygen15083
MGAELPYGLEKTDCEWIRFSRLSKKDRRVFGFAFLTSHDGSLPTFFSNMMSCCSSFMGSNSLRPVFSSYRMHPMLHMSTE